MGKWDLRRLWGRNRGVSAADATAEPVRGVSVDTALVIKAARHVVTTRVATQASLARHLYVAPDVADQLLARLEHCEVIGPDAAGRRREVFATSGELPELIAEFQRRG